MYSGGDNTNMLQVVQKMTIINVDGGDEFTVLYNPESYTQSRTVNYSRISMLGANGPVVQFQSGGAEVVSFDLFFDSLYAGPEIGGGLLDKAKFTLNMFMTDLTNLVDIRKYTKKVYDLMEIEPSVHRPPLLMVVWGSMQFKGFLASCSQRFTRFDARGRPVRAVVKCQFVESPKLNRKTSSLMSPDTTKYHVTRTGDALWSISERAYGDQSMWREVARANDMANPRALATGDTLAVPALVD